MIIVSNTTPLIGLASIGKFHLLHDLFIKVYIPQAVYNEAVVFGYEEVVVVGWAPPTIL